MSESIPATIGKYQIIREIARSNDIVYEAYDPKMTRRVAVKELAMPRGATPQQREDRLKRFEREARAAGSLVHPNIVTIYEVGTDGDKNYIAMEFLTGRNLRKEIDKTGFVEPNRAVEIAMEVLEGLAFAHEHGVIHRDIKPDNVQLLEDGQIKLTDFGIARLTFEPNITMDGQVFGTPSYMSPEQINGQEIDARSDLFGVGVLLYEMVSGQKPFQGDSVVSITYAIMNKRPDQPQQANYQLWQVIERALEKTPDTRYRSAGEMIEALKHVQKGFLSGVFEPQGQPAFSSPFIPGQVAPGPPPVYNPYQPTVHTPYGTPLPGQPGGGAVPGGMYQPYQPQQTVAPYQGGSPTGQVPVYYPPPPRQPLLKPEHKRGIANFFIAVLLIGATIGFVILVISALTNTLPSRTASNEEAQPPLTTEQLPPAVSNEAQNPTASAPRPAGNRTAAPPVDTALSVDVAELVAQAEGNIDLAAETESPGMRLQLYSDADVLYSQAIDASPDANKVQMSLRASNKYVSVGNSLIQVGQRERAREAYRRAKGYAQVDPELLSQIDLALEQLGG